MTRHYETLLFSVSLTKLYKQNMRQLSKDYGFTTTINDELVKKTVYSYWVNDGMNWSDRIWKNKVLLKSRLEQGLMDIVTVGRSHAEVTKELMKTFGIGFNNAERVARTELAHIQVQSTLDSYKEAGITKYRYLTAEDERTCEICGALDGKVFDIFAADYSSNLPPRHPNCRCTILGVVEDK